MGKNTYSKVDIGQSIKHIALRVAGSKHLSDWLILFGLDELVGNSLVAAKSKMLATDQAAYEVARSYHYFGSQLTYPLLVPFVSLTTSSRLSKSSAVTASNATSRRTSAHSTKA